jgi:hypothetical protein
MRISKNANNKKSSWKNFLMDKSSQALQKKKKIFKINHLSLKDEQTTSQSKLIPDLESPIKD